jgi:hypothetical protein
VNEVVAPPFTPSAIIELSPLWAKKEADLSIARKVAALMLLACAALAMAQDDAGPKVGMLAPNFTGADQHGVKFKLSDYRGKVVVVDFWGDW